MLCKKRAKLRLAKIGSEPELVKTRRIKHDSPIDRNSQTSKKSLETSSNQKRSLRNELLYRFVPKSNFKLKSDTEVDTSKGSKEKTALIKRISTLRKKIHLIKKENKTLKSSVEELQGIEDMLKIAIQENKELKDRPHWDTIKASLSSFKSLLLDHLIH